MISINELESGSVKRIKVSQLAKLAGESAVTISRKIKSKYITAIADPATGRIFIPVEAALNYLTGADYEHNFQDKCAISRMEKARGAKRSKGGV